jgi:hypothetical protein
MIEENLTDEELLNITGGEAFLDEEKLIHPLRPTHIRKLYNTNPINKIIVL